MEGGQGASDPLLPDPEIPQETGRLNRKGQVIFIAFSPFNQHIKCATSFPPDPSPPASQNSHSAKVPPIPAMAAAEEVTGGSSNYE